MKSMLSLLAVVFVLGLSTFSMNAEAAKRMGSGKSMGTQRQAAPDKSPTLAPQSNVSKAAPGAAAAAPSRSWMGPIAGLAAGLGLAALASHLGLGDELASLVMFGLLAAAVMVAIGFFMRKRAASKQSQITRPGGLRYAHINAGTQPHANDREQAAPAYKVLMPSSGSAIGSGTASGSGSVIGSAIGAPTTGPGRIPTDFDVAAFERNAKLNFIRLQAANDDGNLDDIRQFTTPEMYAEIKLEYTQRGASQQKSDVVRLDAQVIEVDEDADRYLVSVHFTGLIRDSSGEPDESFDEIWHLIKSRQGSGGWVLSGIQQAA